MPIVIPDGPPQFNGPTDLALLAAYRGALMACSSNQAYQIAGKTFTRADLPEIRKTIDWLEERIGDASVVGDGTGIVRTSFRWND